MTASYLSLEVAWKLTPPCLARRVPCQSRSWEVVRWYRGARGVPRRLEVQGCLAQCQLAIPVGWGLQKSRCWQTKPWRSSLQKLKHLPLAALCWFLSRDYQPRLSTGRMEPLARALQHAAQRLRKTSVHLPFRLNTPPVVLSAGFVVETGVCGWGKRKAGGSVLKLLLPCAEWLWLKASWLWNCTQLHLGEQRDLPGCWAATPDITGNSWG